MEAADARVRRLQATPTPHRFDALVNIHARLDVADAFLRWLSAHPPTPSEGEHCDRRRLTDPRLHAVAEIAFHDVVTMLPCDSPLESLRAARRLDGLVRALGTMPNAPPPGPERARLRITLLAIVALDVPNERLHDLAMRFLRPYWTRFDFKTGRPVELPVGGRRRPRHL